MSETFGSGFGFGSYAGEESKEVPQTQEMKEAPSDENTQEFILEMPAPAPAPEPEKPVTPTPKYEISQRPLRTKKRR